MTSLKSYLQIFTDDKYYFVEACLQCIMDGIIHNDLTLWSYWCKLLDSFSKSAADSGCHNHKCCFFHFRFLLIYLVYSMNSVANVISAYYLCSFSFAQLCCLVCCDQTVDDFIQITVHDGVQSVKVSLIL